MRNLLAAAGVVAVLGAAGGAVVDGAGPALTATGPVSVSGTEASGVFTIAERTVRQVRYADRGTLRYTFTLTNGGRMPVEVLGLAAPVPDSRLFDLVSLSSGELGPGESGEFTLVMNMNGCESLSSRSGSFVTRIPVRTERLGMLEDVLSVPLPEELHTGSPREASCPGSTATSRPQG